MKKALTVIFFSLMIITQWSYAQDSSIRIRDMRTLTGDEKPLVVFNGLIYKNNINTINPDSILTVSVLKGPDAEALYGAQAIYGVILINTRSFAIKQYQKKLGHFSRKYKSYVHSFKNDYSNVLYVINGNPVEGKSDDITKTLYHLNTNNIKSVEFNNKGVGQEATMTKSLVIITTK